jgi:hypothetical protein
LPSGPPLSLSFWASPSAAASVSSAARYSATARSHRTLSLLLLSPIEFIGRLAVITACVRLHDARIHGKSLAFDQTHLHRSDDDALENVAQNIALTEPVQSVLGEGRVGGNGVIEIKTTTGVDAGLPSSPPQVSHFSARTETLPKKPV